MLSLLGQDITRHTCPNRWVMSARYGLAFVPTRLGLTSLGLLVDGSCRASSPCRASGPNTTHMKPHRTGLARPVVAHRF